MASVMTRIEEVTEGVAEAIRGARRWSYVRTFDLGSATIVGAGKIELDLYENGETVRYVVTIRRGRIGIGTSTGTGTDTDADTSSNDSE